MLKNLFASLFLLLTLCFAVNLYSQTGADRMLLDGSETLLQFNIDTTGNWWAVTQPFTNQYRAIINGNESIAYQGLTGLSFSNNGIHWAYFAKDNISWNVILPDSSIRITADSVGEIIFSALNSTLAYSYTNAHQEYFVLKDKKIEVYARFGNYYINPNGTKFAYISKRGSYYVMNINGKESQTFDQIKPMGFWHNGDFRYAARTGTIWEIYNNFDPLTETYPEISEVVINQLGTAGGAIIKNTSDYYQSVMFSDEYIEPIFSGKYDKMSNLVIHPYEPMIACNAELNNAFFVIYNTTEYSAEESSSKPMFTHDGSELYFLTCRINCYISVNGKKHKIFNQLDTESPFVKKPNSMTIGYSTNSSMIVQQIDGSEMYGSLLIDYSTAPIYNWRTGFYESLASINNRLYLLATKVN